jgi:hypothetical protein
VIIVDGCKWGSLGSAPPAELQECVSGMIKEMDDVGVNNRGPFVMSKVYRSDDETEVPEQPFW